LPRSTKIQTETVPIFGFACTPLAPLLLLLA
jgi:hypothetical protein